MKSPLAMVTNPGCNRKLRPHDDAHGLAWQVASTVSHIGLAAEPLMKQQHREVMGRGPGSLAAALWMGTQTGVKL